MATVRLKAAAVSLWMLGTLAMRPEVARRQATMDQALTWDAERGSTGVAARLDTRAEKATFEEVAKKRAQTPAGESTEGPADEAATESASETAKEIAEASAKEAIEAP